MIKVYLDWNIMSTMKRGSFDELKTILLNKKKFLLPYSSAHVGDIFSSHSNNEEQQKIIKEDLTYITSLTENECFFNDGNKIQLGYMEPEHLYESLLDSQDMFKDFSIDNLFSVFDDEEDPIISSLVSSLKNVLKSFPLDYGFKEAYDNPETASEMNKVFPGLEGNLSFDGWFKSFGNMYNNLNETEDYKTLRETVQKIGVNSSHFSEGKNPFEVIGKAYKKHGIENTSSYKPNYSDKNAPEWFNEIVDEYLSLDMHGYKQDEIKVNEKKKKTFRNTTNDAFHTGFASRCDFYITNDKKNIFKTNAIYEKLGIDTLVYTPKEFITYYNDYLDIHGFNEHFGNIIDVLETGKNYYAMGNETDEKDNPICFFGLSNHYFFNFFNKVRICNSSTDKSLFYVLSKSHPSSIYYVANKELRNLLSMLVNHLGGDDNDKGVFEIGEINSDNWEGRTWTLETMEISLKRINGWFQLYFYPIIKNI